MDYDENDFQSQNQHLAGEGNPKFSPVLQPYALSKFDFDDNLQGHLRSGTVFPYAWIPHSRDVPLDGFVRQLESKGGDENGKHDL